MKINRGLSPFSPLNVSSSIGIAGLFVDAKHERAKAYYEQFGFISLPEQLDNLFLPLQTLAKEFRV